MRPIILFISLFLFSFSLESSIYQIQFAVPGGSNISMSVFRENKIIITAFSTSHPDRGYLKYLNHLQNNDEALKIIAVPALDFGGDISDQKLTRLKDSLGLSITITRPAYVQRRNAGNQHRLFRWLTKTEENTHFDIDVERYDQLYIISKKGTLYSVLPKGVPAETLDKVLSESITE